MGDYYLDFILPGGYAFSPQDQGNDDNKDSDANPSTGQTAVTTLSSGESDLTWAAGAIVYKIGDDRFSALQGLFRKMPFTMAAMVVGGLSIIGVPPTCGFFSKWYLLTGGIAAGQYAFAAALIFSSLVNVILFFRLFEIGYFKPYTGVIPHYHGNTTHPARSEGIAEAPLDLLVPLLVTAVFLIILGVFSGEIVTRVIRFAIPATIG